MENVKREICQGIKIPSSILQSRDFEFIVGDNESKSLASSPTGQQDTWSCHVPSQTKLSTAFSPFFPYFSCFHLKSQKDSKKNLLTWTELQFDLILQFFSQIFNLVLSLQTIQIQIQQKQNSTINKPHSRLKINLQSCQWRNSQKLRNFGRKLYRIVPKFTSTSTSTSNNSQRPR